jgi:hypothetical protein
MDRCILDSKWRKSCLITSDSIDYSKIFVVIFVGKLQGLNSIMVLNTSASVERNNVMLIIENFQLIKKE